MIRTTLVLPLPAGVTATTPTACGTEAGPASSGEALVVGTADECAATAEHPAPFLGADSSLGSPYRSREWAEEIIPRPRAEAGADYVRAQEIVARAVPLDSAGLQLRERGRGVRS